VKKIDKIKRINIGARALKENDEKIVQSVYFVLEKGE